ncbi:MAG: TetR/AcrR family transcriptional regulator [Proteobacteria bacterium]|nr:TetR/AcrR family transcriptional regulator [Pseudomonadota bacterium]
MSAGVAAGGREARASATRRIVLDAAIAVFAEEGFEGTTMRDVADRSGVKQPLIVYHFENKQKLWRAAVDEVWRRMETAVAEAAGNGGRGFDPERLKTRDDLGRALRAIAHGIASHPEYLRIVLREASHRGDRYAWLDENHMGRNHRDARTLVACAQERGLLPQASVDHLVYILIGALTFAMAIEAEVEQHTRQSPRDPAFLDAHVDALMKLLVPHGTDARREGDAQAT